MDFRELSAERYSVRSYSDRQIEPEKIETIIEAGLAAPTACNNQPQKFYVIQGPEKIGELAEVCKCTFGAPAAILACYDSNIAADRPFNPGHTLGEVDATIACTQMMLQAWELGIGSCWVGYYDSDTVRGKFGIPDNEVIVAILPIGYAAEGSEPSEMHFSHRNREEIVTYIH